MSLRKDMTLNERVFHQNINNRPSIVIWTYLYIYSLFIIYGYVGYFRNYLIANIQLWMLQPHEVNDYSITQIIITKRLGISNTP